jgi:prophage tail gpP-like protein
MSDADVVTLKVSGQLYEGWTDVTVSKGIRNPAGAFSMEFAERADASGGLLPIRNGEACEVLIGGETVISGWIDSCSPSFSATDRSLKVEGRDKAGDLVDCSALNAPGTWAGRTLVQIASDLLAPFGVSVTASTDVGDPFKKFALQQGETAWDAIERLARFRGLLAVSTPAGQIDFIRPGAVRAGFTLRQGEHILSASADHDVKDRYGRYILKGQAAGDDADNGISVAGPKAEATDPSVTRYRPLVIVSEEQATLASLTARAGWEASVRAAAGEKVNLNVQGWRDPAGAIWQANMIMPVEAPWLAVQGDLLIADVTYRLSPSSGSTTTLTCAPPDAYRPEPGAPTS